MWGLDLTESTETPPQRLAKFAIRATIVVTSLSLVPIASAHGDSPHAGPYAGIPHWSVLVLLIFGLGVLVGTITLGRTRWAARPRLVLSFMVVGSILVVVASTGLSDLQVDPYGTNPVPIPRGWYPVIAGVVGVVMLLSSVLLGLWRWSDRPSYPALGILLSLWAAYPVIAPRKFNFWNPLGYGLVLGAPLLVWYVLQRDVWPVISNAPRADRRIGWFAGVLSAVFLLFSTGQFTFNPDDGVGVPHHAFVTVSSFVDPLVMWPSVEVYDPSIPVFGAMNLGTAITFGLLSVLTGINATLAVAVWRHDVPTTRSQGLLGGLATTGASACCCCAPAVYSITGAVVGLSASPLYWIFTDPASPMGDLFFVGAAALMVGSAVQLAGALDHAGVCDG